MTIFRWIGPRASMEPEVARASSMSIVRPAEPLEIEAIHERHADFVWRTLQRLGVRPMDLDDALQEVFMVVHRRLASFDGSSALTTWLFGISLRVAAAQRRKAHRRREQTSETLETDVSADPDASPEALVLEREARARLALVLDSLSLEKRAVFVMFEIEGMSAPLIASTIGIPVGTVYSRLAAARADFKQATARRARRTSRGRAS